VTLYRLDVTVVAVLAIVLAMVAMPTTVAERQFAGVTNEAQWGIATWTNAAVFEAAMPRALPCATTDARAQAHQSAALSPRDSDGFGGWLSNLANIGAPVVFDSRSDESQPRRLPATGCRVEVVCVPVLAVQGRVAQKPRQPVHCGSSPSLTTVSRKGKLLHPGNSVPYGLRPWTNGADERFDDRAATRFLPNGVHAGKREPG
jgi:hypothetical protein